jgi:hypothetical protein
MQDERDGRKDEKDMNETASEVKDCEAAQPCNQEHDKQNHPDAHSFPPFRTNDSLDRMGVTANGAITVRTVLMKLHFALEIHCHPGSKGSGPSHLWT